MREVLRPKFNIFISALSIFSILAFTLLPIFSNHAHALGLDITEFPVSTSSNSLDGITTGPDGNLWFVEQFEHKVGRITPSGTTTYFSVPSGGNPAFITTGPDGNLWFTEQLGNNIGRITPGGTITEFPLPNSNSYPDHITAGPDGNLWFVEQGQGGNIGKITPSGTITEYSVRDGNLYGITAGPDGNVWFTDTTSEVISNAQYTIGNLVKITPSGAMTKYTLPTSSCVTDSNGCYAQDITTGPDSNLWFTEQSHHKVGRMTPDGTFTEFTVPSVDDGSSDPTDITNGPDGNLWFTQLAGNQNIGKITTSGTVTEFPVATTNSAPFGISAGPDGNVWFTETGGLKVARANLRLHVNSFTGATIYAGDTYTASGSFTDPDATSWTATVDYGDNSGTQPLTLSGQNFSLSHQYNATGTYTVTVSITNNQGQTGTGTAIVTVKTPVPPSFPTNLTATSPAQYPSLNWNASSDATSYNIYRSGTNIGSVSNTTYTDNTAPEGTDTYYVTAVNAFGESGPSNSVNVLVDRTAPTITYTISPTPNSNGWNNSSATVTFNCTDNTGGSGIALCSQPQTESADGSYTLSGTAIDNAGNSSSVNVTVNIDQTAPTVSNVALATDPLAVNQTTALSANVADNLSGVTKAEYYTGTDPGQGNGTAMTLTNGSATATVGSYATAGMHTYYVRTEDNAGNWSTPMSVTLDVYNPASGYAAGHGSVVPNGSTSNPGDTLPTESGNNLKANFDFTVKYVNSTDTTPTGTSKFSWGSTCNNPHANCFVVTTDTTVTPAIGSLAWLVVPGDNTATFQGTASLSQGSTNLGTNYPVRVSVTGTTTTSPAHYLLQVYSVGANPDTASPLYQASGDLSGGSVVLHG